MGAVAGGSSAPDSHITRVHYVDGQWKRRDDDASADALPPTSADEQRPSWCDIVKETVLQRCDVLRERVLHQKQDEQRAIQFEDECGLKIMRSDVSSTVPPKVANAELISGSMRGDLQMVQRALKARAEVNRPSIRGITPIMLAASSSGKHAEDVLKHIRDSNGLIEARDNCGLTALLHACRNGKTEMVKYLIAHGANLTHVTSDLKTMLILCVAEGKLDLVRLCMNTKIIRMQVGEKDAFGWTALHYAVRDGFLEISKILIEQNAQVNVKDADGRLPLSIACEHGRLECVKQLCKRDADINMKDKSHRTPLMYAVVNTFEETAIWILKKYEADPYIKDIYGDAPIHIADELGLIKFKGEIKGRRLEGESDEDDGMF